MCDTCDYSAPSICCGKHTLMGGIVRELHQAMMDGKFWGDIEYDWAMERLEEETPEQKAQRELKAKMEEMKRAAELRRIIEEKHVNKNTGKVMKINRVCHHIDRPASIDQWGIKWEAGCQRHKTGLCCALHPGEPGYEQALAAKSQRRRW